MKDSIKKIGKKISDLMKSLMNKFKSSFKDNIVFRIYMLAIMIMAVIMFFVIFVFGGSDAIVKTYSKGLTRYDANKMYSVINSSYIKAIEESSNSKVLDDINKLLEKRKNDKDKYVSYNIVDSYVMTEYESEQLKKEIKIFAPKFDLNKIKKCKRYIIKYKIENGVDVRYTYVSVHLIKVGLTWSVVYNT